MDEKLEDIIRQTKYTVERGEIENIVKRELDLTGGTGVSPIRNICHEKVLNIVEEKIESHDKIITLSTENMVLNLRREIKKDVERAIKQTIESIQDRNTWGLELVKFAITVGSAIGAVKIVM